MDSSSALPPGRTLTLEELERQMFQQPTPAPPLQSALPQNPGASPWSWGTAPWGSLPSAQAQSYGATPFHSLPVLSNDRGAPSASLPQLPQLQYPLPSSSLPSLPQMLPPIPHMLPPNAQSFRPATSQQFPAPSIQSQLQPRHPTKSSFPSSPSFQVSSMAGQSQYGAQFQSSYRDSHGVHTQPSHVMQSQNYVQSAVAEDVQHSPKKRSETGMKAELRARFEWQGVGVMDVRPNVAGPDEYIDVAWEIPARYVSREALLSASSTSHTQKKMSTGSGQNRDDTHQGDWIGLFRSRQRVDDSSGFILTRETHGRATYDAKSDTVRGRVRLRAPRGVGTYDFRYFTVGGINSHNSDDSPQADVHRFPLARSPSLTVEVQGHALFEALQFIEKNVRDKKRLAATAQQLSTLLRQVKTLASPLPNSSARPDEQERKLVEEIWKAVSTCIERGVQLDQALADQVSDLKGKAEEAKSEYELLCKAADGTKAQDTRVDDDMIFDGEFDVQNAEDPKKDDEHLEPIERERRSKRLLWVMIRRDVAQTERDRASVGSAVRGVLDDVRGNLSIFSLLSDQRRRYLVSFARRYSSIEEHFFASEGELREFAKDQLGVARWALTEDGRIEIEPSRASALDHEIDSLLPTLIPEASFFDERRMLIRRLQGLLDSEFSQTYGACRLAPFGSSANSFGGPNSDLDLCLVLLDRPLNSAQDGADAVELVAKILVRHGYQEVDDVRKTARIPIVQFRDHVTNVECDICINNPLAIRNTLLLRTYGSIDERARAVVFLIKLWAKRRNINDPSGHTLSSYGWILLSINFMQRAGLLPVLQDMPVRVPDAEGGTFFPRVPCAGADGKVHDTYFFGDPESPFFATPESRERAAVEARKRSADFRPGVSSLLCAFFWDLAFTDWRRNVASVRTGTFVLKSVKAAEDSWRLHPRCAIEDPFETSYDVGHVLRDSTFRKIRLEAARAYALLVGCFEGSVDAPAHECLEELLRSAN